MKKGIALFSTLMILVLVIMLMSIALKNSTNIKKSSLKDRYLIQENITITDVVKLVEDKITSKLKSLKGEEKVEIQKVLFSNPLKINDSVTNSKIVVSMSPNNGKLNINFINSIDGEDYLKSIFSQIDVKEPQILADIILANITNSDKYNDDYKIHLKQLDKSFGYINSYEEFEDMLAVYVQNTDDIEAFSINFRKYLNFYVEVQKDGKDKKYNRLADNILDINYVPIELVDSIVGLKNSIRKNIQTKKYSFYSFTDLQLDSKTAQQKKLEDYGFGFETQNILLEINITSINNRVKYLLNYNLNTKKISKISMDRWIY